MTVARPRGAWVIIAVLALCPAFARAQTPALYESARADLASADTAGAIRTLRLLVEEEPDYAPGWGLLGRVLTARSSWSATEFTGRVAAEDALRRALELDPDNPSNLASFGRLKRKQQIYLDSRRLLDRAIRQLEERGGELDAEELADLWFERGIFEEDEYLDYWHYYTMPRPPPVQTPQCSGIGSFCMNFTRPGTFNEHFLAAVDLSEDAEDDFEEMVDAFMRALEADPAHPGAFRRLAIHFVDRGDYGRARELSRTYIESAPEEPWGYLIEGLVAQRTGSDSLAELALMSGIERADAQIANHYRDVENLLRASLADLYSGGTPEQRRQLERVLWARSDPLYLTDENEVRVEYLARVAYADIMFEDRTDKVWGAETEQGVIYIRYGPPRQIWKIQRNPRLEAASLETAGAAGSGDGRWIFWNYGMDIPNFIFQKVGRYRRTSHVMSSFSKSQREQARANMPAVFNSEIDFIDYPVQVARFKGPVEGIVEADFHSELPGLNDLVREARPLEAEIEVGFYVLAAPNYLRVVERKTEIEARDSPLPLTYGAALPGGDYYFSVEGRAEPSRAAVRRGDLELVAFAEDSLALSDIVLARTVAPRLASPSDRHGFAINVNRRVELEYTDPFSLYWEVYGLGADGDGFATYQVRVTVTDAEGRGFFANVVRALGSVVSGGGDDDVELVFERTVELVGDRVPEYLELALVSDEPGDYLVRIEVVDAASGGTAMTERAFRLTAP